MGSVALASPGKRLDHRGALKAMEVWKTERSSELSWLSIYSVWETLLLKMRKNL